MAAGRDANAVKVGPGRLYIGPIGTAEPTALTSAPNAAFVDLGYTEEGSTFTFGTDVETIDVAEEFYSLDQIVTGKTVQVAFSLAQDTAYNLSVAMNGGTTTVGATDIQFEPPSPGTEAYVMLLWEDGATVAANKRRFLFRKCFQGGSAELAHAKGADYTKIPVEFTALKPTGDEPFIAFYHPLLKGTA